jgi:hypothetical protein
MMFDDESLFSLRFPFDDVAESVDSACRSQLLRFAGKSPDEAAAPFLKQWEATADPTVKQFAEAVAARLWPRGVVIDPMNAGNWYVAWTARSVPLSENGATLSSAELSFSWFLKEPHKRGAFRKLLRERNAWHEFRDAFPGLRCTAPPESGAFNESPCGAIECYPGEIAEKCGREWAEAAAIYRSSCGDELLMTKHDRFGWLAHETRKIVPYTDDFATVLNDLCRYGGLECPHG